MTAVVQHDRHTGRIRIDGERPATEPSDRHLWSQAAERALWREVLTQAIEDIALRGPSLPATRARREAMRWIVSEDASHIGSFLAVCSLLDLDADALRARLLVIYEDGEAVRACA